MWLWASRPVTSRAPTFPGIAVGMTQEAVCKAPGPARAPTRPAALPFGPQVDVLRRAGAPAVGPDRNT